MTVNLIAEHIIPRFCTEICLGCGIAPVAVRLKSCPIVRLDVFLQLSMEDPPSEVARNLQKTIDKLVDNDLVKIVRARRGHATNKKR